MSLDRYLAGLDSAEHQTSTATSIPSDIIGTLNNPFYYIPIEVEVGTEVTSYIIAPRIAPLWANPDRQGHVLARKPDYYSASIAGRLLVHHTVLRDGKIDEHPARIISNPYGPHQTNFFHNTLQSLNNLTAAWPPVTAVSFQTYRHTAEALKATSFFGTRE